MRIERDHRNPRLWWRACRPDRVDQSQPESAPPHTFSPSPIGKGLLNAEAWEARLSTCPPIRAPGSLKLTQSAVRLYWFAQIHQANQRAWCLPKNHSYASLFRQLSAAPACNCCPFRPTHRLPCWTGWISVVASRQRVIPVRIGKSMPGRI